MKYFLKIILFSFVFLFFVFDMASASWRAGNRKSNAYGVRANIRTPISEPHLVAEGISSWVSLPTPNWLQAGWRFYIGIPGGKPLQYIEYKDKYGAQDIMHYEIQDWNSIDNYKVVHRSGETWCAYINDVQKFCAMIRSAPVEVQALSEVHVSMFNELDARFTAVYYRTSNNLWYVFNQERWVEDFPYMVRKDYLYAYSTYRTSTVEVYIPIVLNSP